MNRKLSNRRLELDSVFRGMLVAFICVFSLPVVVAIFILTAYLLNLRQGFLTSVPFPDPYWKNLLSFAFRISLIPGIVYLASRGLSRLRGRHGEKRLALVIASLILFTILIVMPPKQQSRVAISGIELKPEAVKEVIYKADSQKSRAVDKKGPPNTVPLQRS